MLLSGNAIFWKGKCFHVFGCISKNFLKNIFWCLEKKKEKTNPDKPRRRRRQRDLDLRRRRSSIVAAVDRNLADRIAHWSTSGAITPSIAIYCDEWWRSTIAIDERRDRRARSLDDRTAHRSTSGTINDRCSPIWALSSLSLSLFPEMIWSENEGGKSFPGQRWKYWSTGQPNMQVWGKMIS